MSTDTRPRRKAKPNPRLDWTWQQDAACYGEPLVLFFGPEGERQPERDIREREAKSICSGCPTRAACLDYALDNNQKYGLYGGLTEDERAAVRRRRQRSALRAASS